MRGNKKTKNIIGVFDSGLGGLTVLKEFLKIIPNYNYIYLGDSARVPYGNKSDAVIYQYTKEAIDFLFSQGCNLIIIACNTASAKALRKIQQEYLLKNYPGKNVLGVIRPLAEKFALSNFKKIGVIGTKATIGSHAYKTEIKKLNKKINIIEKPTPLLVPLVEESWASTPAARLILKKYLQPLKAKNIQALILGCTHYPFLLNDIKAIMGKKCLVPNTGAVIAQSLKNYLKRHPEYNLKQIKNPKYKFFTSDDPKKFKELGEKFLGRKIKNISKAILE